MYRQIVLSDQVFIYPRAGQCKEGNWNIFKFNILSFRNNAYVQIDGNMYGWGFKVSQTVYKGADKSAE